MTGNGFFSKSDLGPAKRRYAQVETELGTFRIQSWTEGEFSRYEDMLLEDDGRTLRRSGWINARKYLIATSVVDSAGERVFGDNEYSLIAQLDTRITDQLTAAIRLHCGLAGDEAPEKN